jgi:hypothetical protein
MATMYLANGEVVRFTPAGESTYTPTPEGVVVKFNGVGCAVRSSERLFSWAEAQERAKNADFGDGFRVALKHR